MTPAEYGAYLASLAPPITEEQAEAAARIQLAAAREQRLSPSSP